MKLTKVVEVDQEKCANCHRCIAVCPVKYCNYSSVDSVAMHKGLCKGCGECLRVCKHNARVTAIVTVQFSEWVDHTTKITKEITSMIEQIRKDAEEAVTSMQQETKK
jgi:Pyruvate/2-oxoacid:ferredoxin oxidoreductase delta subunit